MRRIDSHVHLLDERFDADREALIAGLAEQGIVAVIECATDREDIPKAVALAQAHSNVLAAVGIHPHSASEYGEDIEAALAQYYMEGRAVAIGEIGLDYHYDFSPRDVQRDVFARQLALAERLGAPAILHIREATEDALAILREHPRARGVLHCFSGSCETAQTVLEMGWYIGFGGSLTFKGNRRGAAVATMAPEDRFLLETDCPYLAPVPRRGERNEPAFTALVAEKLAELRGETPEAICAQALRNTKRLFGIACI